MAFAEGRAGATVVSDGSPRELRLGRLGEVITGNAGGKYYELSRRGMIFSSTMQTAASLGTALTATAVTLTLYNPLGSGVNLSMLQCAVAIHGAMQTTTQTANAYAYAVNIGPINTALVLGTSAIVVPGLLGLSGATAAGSGSNAGQAYRACTLPVAPIAARWHPASFGNFTTASAVGGLGGVDYIDGALVVGQGAAVTLQGIATSTATSGVVSFTWAEIPV